MDRDTLEESLEEIFGTSFSIETDENGELVIHTALQENEDGELIPWFSEEDEDDDEDDSDLDLEELPDEDADDDD